MEFLKWDTEDVAKWVESIGFSKYKACFTENFITGKKLIHVNCNNLPKLGITDFRDMLVISACVRVLLGITETPWNNSIADPRRDTVALFLEVKSRTGKWTNSLTYQQFLYYLEDPDYTPEPESEHDENEGYENEDDESEDDENKDDENKDDENKDDEDENEENQQ
ncbi:sterile alpha motif domain-containing protein 15-like [Poecilia latipinna]|uniref:Sterile alpha motif domain-containing protein 15-like n=1 Tax=Poecilia latipinna TaxID=48699 RepID=A0A3B3TNW3_9TELE|nr:PREDICTED: sterile alpha motif domain-containing protein 15-like [Poecilia latipinna]XP_014899637.1 PREDICTED: sterile alpha motif domain-containing protein 15-like [Poecilia latipinna]